MNAVPYRILPLTILVGLSVCLAEADQSAKLAWAQLAQDVPPDAAELAPMPPVDESPPDSGAARPDFRRRRGWRSRSRSFGKNHASVKAAFGDAAQAAAAATVEIICDGETIALGTVVDAGGYVVSKASLLVGELKCRGADQRAVDAEIVGVQEDVDLALLKVASDEWTVVSWRAGAAAPPGTLVAAVGVTGEALAVGVVSTEPRTVRGSSRAPQRRGWLGIQLGGGEDGLVIQGVTDSSAAKTAGLEVGDRINSLDGAEMKSVQQVVETVGSHGPGETIELVVERDGQTVELSATLGTTEDRPSPQDNWGGGPFSQRRSGFPSVIPHDTVVRPEQCGGPLVDINGGVVGINIARALRVSTYALSAETVQKAVEELRKSETAARD